MDSVDSMFDSLTAAAVNGSLSEKARVDILEAATKLITALQKPEDAITKLAYQPTIFMATRTLLELGVFKHIVEKERITSQELATATKADKILLERLLRVLTASGYVTELDESVYGPNPLTKALTTRQTAGLVEFIYDYGMISIAKLPEYFEKYGYRNPDNQLSGPPQYGHNIPGQELFPYIASRPKLLSAAHAFFEGDRGSRPLWVDWFPVQEKLLDEISTTVGQDDILYVDVAGGRGHDLLDFKRKFGEFPGRYVLMDLPHVVNDETLCLTGVEKRSFDFFKDQVVPGARIYYMEFILHDWNDELCLKLLRNVTAGMKRGHSTLIVEDFIVPAKGASLLPAITLFERAGLEIEGFYQPPGDGTGIVVLNLAEAVDQP
ncbi:hypothetical protein E8E13_007005 [Curvularia kusanoi]|uniref:O-methyltransferase domain-containing protein n=1 Tax=Curvularia kusanoi TaxID=90978 RepID=A0A9P4T9F9_CURKU|nr:hypothetical protein E8E13_007005 [Curvularia kusanoi]